MRKFKIQRFIEILLIVLPIILLAGCGSSHHLSTKNNITWYSMEEAQQLAKKDNKKVLIYAEASWCVYCKKMEKKVFPQQSVVDSLQSYYYPVKIDIESEKAMVFNGHETEERKFARQNHIQATPTTFFVSPKGKVLGTQPGFIPADIFSRLLAYVGKGVFKNQDFKEYLKGTRVE